MTIRNINSFKVLAHLMTLLPIAKNGEECLLFPISYLQNLCQRYKVPWELVIEEQQRIIKEYIIEDLKRRTLE